MVPRLKIPTRRGPADSGRGVAQPGQRACFGSRRSGVQISAPRPSPFLRSLLWALVLLGPASVGLAEDGAWYRVRRGDNLTIIARRFGVTLAELRSDNGLASDVIHPDQRLRFSRPLHRLSSGQIRWRCPLGHPRAVLREYGRYRNEQGTLLPHTGMDLGAAPGSEVVSPATGVVRYVGPQDGFGLLVIVEHGAGYASVLAPLDPERVKVEAGEAVLGGTPLGHVGQPVEHARSYLHVELRRNNKAIDPARIRR